MNLGTPYSDHALRTSGPSGIRYSVLRQGGENRRPEHAAGAEAFTEPPRLFNLPELTRGELGALLVRPHGR